MVARFGPVETQVVSRVMEEEHEFLSLEVACAGGFADRHHHGESRGN